MSLIDKYLQKGIHLEDNVRVFYVGTESNLFEGIKRFLSILKKDGEIIVEKEICDFLVFDAVQYVILVRSLPKLKYLEYLYNKKKNR